MEKSIIQASSLQIETKYDHPNKVPFSGVLCYLDKPSENAPSGTSGRKLLITSDVAQSSLQTLIGMGVNCSYWLDEHEVTNKIGIIDNASIENNQLLISGYLFGRDFSEQVNDIKDRQSDIGFSLESTETILSDYDWNGENVAKVEAIVFTGAAILYKWSAAYTSTSIAANKSKEEKKVEMEKVMEAIASLKTDLTTEITAAVTKVKEDILKEVGEVQAATTPVTPVAPKRETLDATQLLAQNAQSTKTDVLAAIDAEGLSTVDAMAKKLSLIWDK